MWLAYSSLNLFHHFTSSLSHSLLLSLSLSVSLSLSPSLRTQGLQILTNRHSVVYKAEQTYQIFHVLPFALNQTSWQTPNNLKAKHLTRKRCCILRLPAVLRSKRSFHNNVIRTLLQLLSISGSGRSFACENRFIHRRVSEKNQWYHWCSRHSSKDTSFFKEGIFQLHLLWITALCGKIRWHFGHQITSTCRSLAVPCSFPVAEPSLFIWCWIRPSQKHIPAKDKNWILFLSPKKLHCHVSLFSVAPCCCKERLYLSLCDVVRLSVCPWHSPLSLFYAFLDVSPQFFSPQIFLYELWVKQGATQCYQAF